MHVEDIADLRAERDHVLAVCGSLSPQEWSAASDCPGWRVQDVIAHLGSLAHAVVAPWTLRLARTAEATNDRLVDERRDWPPERVLAEYETWSHRLLSTLELLRRPIIRHVPIPIPGLGRYPAGLLVNAVLFDHHLHLRHDLLAPTGPIHRPAPPTSASTMSAILRWMLTGLPQMCREELAWLTEPVVLELTGPGGGTWTVSHRGIHPGSVSDSAARVTTRAAHFEVWATRRRSWQDFDVELSGNVPVADRFCSSLNII